MLKIEFTNAVVKDDGFGLWVNGKWLSDIISTALGTQVNGANRADLPDFESNCCNVTIIIDPQPITAHISTDTRSWSSVKAMEEEKIEQFKQKIKAAETEE